MSDENLETRLHAYANHLQTTASPAPAAVIRDRGDRRRRNRAVGATFAGVLIALVGVGVALDRGDDRSMPPAGPLPSATVATSPSAGPSTSASSVRPTSSVLSDVSQLRSIGVALDAQVLIDVADDGADHWMQVGAGHDVDFTGSAKDDSTAMTLTAAPVTGLNRVLIMPLTLPGSCVAATPQAPLALRDCQIGDATQIWKVVPAGDSGQFELEGKFGILKVGDKSLVAADQSGWTGMQTITF